MREVLKRLMPKGKMSTSLSDNQLYPNFCLKASADLRTFSNFRRSPVYRQILEHVDYKTGLAYLEEIRKHQPGLLKDISLFKQNDEWGSPELPAYPEIGTISPSTLRYVKVLSDLVTYFQSMDGLRICEIGVGYGGQCRIINSVFSPAAYTLVDIQPALMLTQRYLDNYVLNGVTRYETMNELEVREYDLLISNYAFTELPRPIQDVYLRKIILHSKRGYITYNDIVPEYFKSYKKEELLEMIPNARISAEIPLTHARNCIITWG